MLTAASGQAKSMYLVKRTVHSGHHGSVHMLNTMAGDVVRTSRHLLTQSNPVIHRRFHDFRWRELSQQLPWVSECFGGDVFCTLLGMYSQVRDGHFTGESTQSSIDRKYTTDI